jgi:hypothetical protein
MDVNMFRKLGLNDYFTLVKNIAIPGVAEFHPGIIGTHPGTKEAHLVAIKAEPEAIEELGVKKTHSEGVDAHLGVAELSMETFRLCLESLSQPGGKGIIQAPMEWYRLILKMYSRDSPWDCKG